MPWSASLDAIRQVRLVPRIERAFWSTERAWPGATVRIHVETRFVPDGTAVKLEVRSADPGVPAIVHSIDDAATIEDSRCILEHAIDWEDEAVISVLDATSVCSFCFVVTIEKYGLVTTSTPLYVPFERMHP